MDRIINTTIENVFRRYYILYNFTIAQFGFSIRTFEIMIFRAFTFLKGIHVLFTIPILIESGTVKKTYYVYKMYIILNFYR